MNVAAILRLKGRAVTTAKSNTPLLQIATKLCNKRIGAIVIVGLNGTVAGIVSERDIIRVVSEQGPDALKRPVSETMIRNVLTCEEQDTIDQVMAMMTSQRFRHLPVMKDSALVAHRFHWRRCQASYGRRDDGGHRDT